jgi:DNA-binding NarL/FixJ family response regulator
MSEEEIECRRAKILELKSQGLNQRDIAQVSHLSLTTITFTIST